MNPTRACRAAALLTVAACALGGSVPAVAAPGPAEVDLTVGPAVLPITTGQCNGGQLLVQLTNAGPDPVYADVELTGSDVLWLPRRHISTWLPAGYSRTVPVTVTAPDGTAPGSYAVLVAGGTRRATVPVTVGERAPSPDLARSAKLVSASSSRVGFPVCGAVDGAADPAHFGPGAAWADATGRKWPDWYQLTWDTPQLVSRVDLSTAGSAAFPAERYGLRDWDVQVGTAAGWLTVAEVRGNTAAIVSSSFPAQHTDSLRVVTLAANGGNDQSRIVELSVPRTPPAG